jgi:XTP/dITP diphosphohydrolase
MEGNQLNNYPMQLVIASKNVHKIRETKAILQQFKHLDILTLLDFPEYQSPEEGNKSFDENAILKATTAAKTLNKWVIADDSGLVVPSLNGFPGVVSSRFAGKNATDKDNRLKLLEAMQDLNDENRNAYYHCSMALSSPTELKKCISATCEGTIIKKERGGGGFGYDPLFIKHEYSKTFGELEDSIKNCVSHRRRALDKILLILESVAK